MRWLAIVVVMVLGWTIAAGAAQAGSGGGFLGAQLMPLTPEVTAELGISGTSGALVVEILSNSPAAKAGLAANQVIVAIGGERIGTPQDVVRLIGGHRPGDTVNLLVMDPKLNYMVATVRVTLGERPADLDAGAPPADAATGQGGGNAPAPAPQN